MFKFFSFFLCSLFLFSCFAKDTQHVVHNHCKNCFSLNGDDYVYDEEDTDYWIQIGDFLLIEDYEQTELPGGSFQALVLVRSLEKHRAQCFKSRVMTKQNSMTVLEAKEISRTTEDPKWIPGLYHPEVVYQLKMEDGSHYQLWCPYSAYGNKEEAESVLASLIVEPGDSVIFNYVISGSLENPYVCTYLATISHEGEKRDYCLDGHARHTSKPLKKPNIFQVAEVGTHQIYGIWPRSFEMVKFHDFLPYQILRIVHSDFSMDELSKKSELKFVRTQKVCGRTCFVFKDKRFFSSKEVIVSPWQSPGF